MVVIHMCFGLRNVILLWLGNITFKNIISQLSIPLIKGPDMEYVLCPNLESAQSYDWLAHTWNIFPYTHFPNETILYNTICCF